MDEINETILYLFDIIRQPENCYISVVGKVSSLATVARKKQNLAVVRELLQQTKCGNAAFVVKIGQCVIQDKGSIFFFGKNCFANCQSCGQI